jgi:hypothetical protein
MGKILDLLNNSSISRISSFENCIIRLDLSVVVLNDGSSGSSSGSSSDGNLSIEDPIYGDFDLSRAKKHLLISEAKWESPGACWIRFAK